jgi:hypothetical protein
MVFMNWQLVLTIIVFTTLIFEATTTASTSQILSQPSNAQPRANFKYIPAAPLQEEQGVIEMKQFPRNPLTSSWSFFSFMPHNKAIPPNTVIAFSLVVGQPYQSPSICTLPSLLDGTSNPFPLGAFSTGFAHRSDISTQFEQTCVAFDKFNDPQALSPIIAGALFVDTSSAESQETRNTCQLAFRSNQHAYIPQQWEITCMVQFPPSPSLSGAEDPQLVIVKTLTLELDPNWAIMGSDLQLPRIEPLQDQLIWLDLDIDYKAGRVESFQRIDQLVLKFTNLPPNIAVRLEFAFDVNDVDRFDRLMFLNNELCQHLATAMQAMDIATTNFQNAQNNPNGARIVFSLGDNTQPTELNKGSGGLEGFYLITNEQPPESVEFNLPIPVNSLLSQLMIPTDDSAQSFWAAHDWDGKNIAVYVRLQQQRLFRFDSTDPRAKWDLRTPLLHQYYTLVPNNVLTQTKIPNTSAEWKLDVVTRSHFILMGGSPSIQLIDYRGPDLPHFNLAKLFTPVADGGYLLTTCYTTSPANSHNSAFDIPFTLPTQPHVFEFSSKTNSQRPYFGYANVTIAFHIPPDQLYPFSLEFLLNGKFRQSIAMVPGSRHYAASIVASDDLLQFQYTTRPSHNAVNFPCTYIRVDVPGNVAVNPNVRCNLALSDTSDDKTPKGRDKIPVLMDSYYSDFRVGEFEMRSQAGGIVPSKCDAFYSDGKEAEDSIPTQRTPIDDVEGLFKQYDIPYRPIEVSSGVVNDFLPVLSQDSASWIEITAYTFPGIDIVLTCDYQVDHEIIKPSFLALRHIMYSRQGVFIEPFETLAFPTTWKHEKRQLCVEFVVQSSMPILSEEDFQCVLDSFITILQKSTYHTSSTTSPSMFRDITVNDVYATSNTYPNLSYQHSSHFSSLARHVDEVDTYKHSLYSLSKYTTATIVFSIPLNILPLPPGETEYSLPLSKHTFSSFNNTMISNMTQSTVTLVQSNPKYMGTVAGPVSARIPDYGLCYSASQCAGGGEEALCINGKCVTRYHSPQLSVREYYILEQYQFHKRWLRGFTLPPAEHNVEHTSYSWVYKTLFIALFIAAIVAVSLIAHDCYRKSSQHKQKKQTHHSFSSQND